MFLGETQFQEIIEEIVWMKDISYFDAVLDYCKENEVDAEDVTKLISSNLREKIRLDCENVGLLEKTARLPI